MSDTEDLARTVDGIVGRALRARREELRLAQDDLATALGVTRQQISKYESGRDRIAVGQLAVAAGVLGRPVSWFFAREDRPSRFSQHCALLPLEQLLPDFTGETLTARVLFTSDTEAEWPGLAIGVVTLVDPALPRAPVKLPREFHRAILRHGAAALLAVAAAGDTLPEPDAGLRAGAALN